MAKLGDIKEIKQLKECLEGMKVKGWINEWELPYENLLTRLSAAIVFIKPSNDDFISKIIETLEETVQIQCTISENTLRLALPYKITFS